MLWSVLRIAIAVYVLFGLIVCIFQKRFIYFPQRRIDAAPDRAGLAYEDVFLTAADGVKIHGWYVPAEDARGAVLFCHGNAGNISHRLPTLELLHELRFSTLIFDYRGYGRSEGAPGEKGTYLDAQAAWDHLVTARKTPPQRIVVFGRSLGGAVAAHLAAENAPGAIVLDSAFTSIPDLARRMYPIYPVGLLARVRYDTLARMKRVRCPVLVIHSRDDEIVPFRHGRRLFEAAGEPKQFLALRGGHNEAFLASAGRYKESLSGFLSAHAGK